MTTYDTATLSQPVVPALLELYEFDFADIPGLTGILRLYNHFNEANSLGAVAWSGGSTYWYPWAISAANYEASTQGTVPEVDLSVGNIGNLPGVGMTWSQLCLDYDDLVGASVTRYLVFQSDIRIIGRENQPDGTATSSFEPDEFRIVQKRSETRAAIQFALAPAYELPSVRLPLRQVLRSDFPGVDRFQFRGGSV